jgi:hypothetical protein
MYDTTWEDNRMNKSAQSEPQGRTMRKQVFIAYSYKLYPKADYRKVYRQLEQKYDVTFIFADEKITNMHIMKKIETFIRGSDFTIFDISGWNPNVTLELGFAMAVSDQWYIAIDPLKTEIKDVPSDLRGLDRIEYDSYDELGNKLSILLEQRYPLRKRSGIEEFLQEKQKDVLSILKEHPGLTVEALAQLLSIDVQVAQLVMKPLLINGTLEMHEKRRYTQYFLKAVAPDKPS